MEYWINTYGYAAVFVGCFLEGETILVLGAFAAHRGYLSLTGVCLAAFAGTFFGDQLYFFLGRKYGVRLVERRRTWQSAADRARRLLDRYGIYFVLSFRFLYGLRTVSPVVIGIAGMPSRLYTPLNFVAAAVWTVALAAIGYIFGEAFVAVLEKAKRYELHGFAVIAGTGLVIWLLYLIIRWWRMRKYGDGTE